MLRGDVDVNESRSALPQLVRHVTVQGLERSSTLSIAAVNGCTMAIEQPRTNYRDSIAELERVSVCNARSPTAIPVPLPRSLALRDDARIHARLHTRAHDPFRTSSTLSTWPPAGLWAAVACWGAGATCRRPSRRARKPSTAAIRASCRPRRVPCH
jgi:hypothetical protein